MTAMEPATLLRCRDLVAGHGKNAVLRGVSLDVRAGESWFVLGTNATGKSTLVATLLGILPPLGGEAGLGAGTTRGDLGYVPQRADLVKNLPTTPHELVLLGLVGLRLARVEREARIAEALEQVGLSHALRADYWSLSGGQRQRVLLARALARRPRLLCVDEPMNQLDLVTERAVLELLARRQRDQGLALLYVTHQVALAAHLATHVALVHHGGVETGRAAELLAPARLELAYDAPVPIAPYPGLVGAARGGVA